MQLSVSYLHVCFYILYTFSCLAYFALFVVPFHSLFNGQPRTPRAKRQHSCHCCGQPQSQAQPLYLYSSTAVAFFEKNTIRPVLLAIKTKQSALMLAFDITVTPTSAPPPSLRFFRVRLLRSITLATLDAKATNTSATLCSTSWTLPSSPTTAASIAPMLVDSRGAAAEEDFLRGTAAEVAAAPPLLAPDDFLWAGFWSFETRRTAWKKTIVEVCGQPIGDEGRGRYIQ